MPNRRDHGSLSRNRPRIVRQQFISLKKKHFYTWCAGLLVHALLTIYGDRYSKQFGGIYKKKEKIQNKHKIRHQRKNIEKNIYNQQNPVGPITLKSLYNLHDNRDFQISFSNFLFSSVPPHSSASSASTSSGSQANLHHSPPAAGSPTTCGKD